MDKEAKTEADWAVMYANERKLRMKCQERIRSFMCNAPALTATSKDLCLAAINAKKGDHDFMEMLVTVIRNSNDLLADININVFEPVAWELSDQELTQLEKATCWENMGRAMMQRISKIIEDSAQDVNEQWHDICHERGLKCPTQVDEESRQEFEAAIEKRRQHEH